MPVYCLLYGMFLSNSRVSQRHINYKCGQQLTIYRKIESNIVQEILFIIFRMYSPLTPNCLHLSWILADLYIRISQWARWAREPYGSFTHEARRILSLSGLLQVKQAHYSTIQLLSYVRPLYSIVFISLFEHFVFIKVINQSKITLCFTKNIQIVQDPASIINQISTK